jgi:hypothetical protein
MKIKHPLFTRISAVLFGVAVLTSLPVLAGEVTLEDNSLLVSFDSDSGALTRLENKTTHWTIERRSELGVSFRLFAPLPDRRDNFVLGQKQKAVEVKKVSDHEVQLQWKDLVSEHGGVLPMTLTADVTLTNGALMFEAMLENDSPLTVETIDYPYFGDFNPPGRDTTLEARTIGYGTLNSDEIYPNFQNEMGYWGVDFPTKAINCNGSLFCLIQTPREGLYVEMHDPTQPYLLEYTFEQHPGVISEIGGIVPKTDEISGLPVHLEFRTCHFVFAHPNSTVKLVPIVLRCYQGDWHAGVDLYKEWRATWFKPPRVPDWAKDIHSWLQLQINSPEQNYLVAYTNLIQYGEECASNGVGAIQLVGWNHGGQDGGDPAQDTDPGLGTWQELHDAIAQIQAKGVKIILFGKLNWADLTTAWYTNELYKYACTDPYGIPYQQQGYNYFTPTQLAGINTHRRAIMDVLCPAYRDVATKEFQKVLALGSAGWLWDEVSGHATEYNFAPDHGYAPPGYVYAGDIPMAERLHAAADGVNPDFLFAGESVQDWLLPYYPFSYFRIDGNSTPIMRYIDPQEPLMVAVTGFDGREMLNMVLLHRYVISYEPYNFKGHITDFPLTLAYGQKIDALRRKYRAYLWDGDFRDTLGANVSADGAHRYSVFITSGGKRAVVVINQEFTKAITAAVNLPKTGKLVVATPENPDAQPTTGTLEIPARSAAVVMEQ